MLTPRHCYHLAALLACLGAAWAGPPEPSGIVRDSFTKWDADHDASLTIEEVNWALASPENKGAEAAALAAIYRASRSKSRPFAPPYSVGQLVTAFTLPGKNQDLDNEPDLPDLAGFYNAAFERIESSPRELFVSGSPTLETFRQGKIGSCFCLAPMAALIHRDAKDAAARFTPAEDGWSVHISPKRSVWVSQPTDGELAISSSTGNDGVWSTVYEKAVGQLRIEDKGAKGPPLIAATAGSAGTMVSVLTGHTIKRFSCSPWRKAETSEDTKTEKLKELRALLADAMAGNRLITAGTASKGSKVPGISSWHAYAVLGYDAGADTVTLRDPHGKKFQPKGTPGLANGYPIEKGVFDVPLAQVVEFMGGFAFEQGEAGEAKAESDDTTFACAEALGGIEISRAKAARPRAAGERADVSESSETWWTQSFSRRPAQEITL